MLPAQSEELTPPEAGHQRQDDHRPGQRRQSLHEQACLSLGEHPLGPHRPLLGQGQAASRTFCEIAALDSRSKHSAQHIVDVVDGLGRIALLLQLRDVALQQGLSHFRQLDLPEGRQQVLAQDVRVVLTCRVLVHGQHRASPFRAKVPESALLVGLRPNFSGGHPLRQNSGGLPLGDLPQILVAESTPSTIMVSRLLILQTIPNLPDVSSSVRSISSHRILSFLDPALPYFLAGQAILAACRLPPAACRLPPADCRLPTADCRLPTAEGYVYVDLADFEQPLSSTNQGETDLSGDEPSGNGEFQG